MKETKLNIEQVTSIYDALFSMDELLHYYHDELESNVEEAFILSLTSARDQLDKVVTDLQASDSELEEAVDCFMKSRNETT